MSESLSGPHDKLPHDRCGNGWGNNVRIHHGNGLISMYAHLSEIFVKTGDHVKAGQVIGIEGASGAAGRRHLHFDVQQIPGDGSVWQEVLSIPDLNALSVPYKLEIIIDGKSKIMRSDEVHCRWDDMTQKPWTAR